ncbi:hypothetical protein [Paenibacillus koleovorans]|uniref:hypothetical protein n=1 Tax=Paenibacillus koleovorans TaxID=121608 RepID=UPI000FD9F71A|nr:hypothetical protein [Paenibacillus koleovorans]
MSEEDLLRFAAAEDVAAFAAFAGIREGELSFVNLIDYAAEFPEQLEQAVRHGYQITYNTINGMKYYFGLTFDKLRERDYPNLPDRIEGLKLSLSGRNKAMANRYFIKCRFLPKKKVTADRYWVAEATQCP